MVEATELLKKVFFIEFVTYIFRYFLPVLNPDGYEYTHTHDRMWRKNRARYGECVGVDLNRNFRFDIFIYITILIYLYNKAD